MRGLALTTMVGVSSGVAVAEGMGVLVGFRATVGVFSTLTVGIEVAGGVGELRFVVAGVIA